MKARPIQTKKKELRSGKRSGFFITLEGIEGCGKTTQSLALASWLRTQGYTVLETREPGGTPLAEEIRALLLNIPSSKQGHQRITPVCEAALVLASRSHHVAHKIRPALSKVMWLCAIDSPTRRLPIKDTGEDYTLRIWKSTTIL